MSSGDFKRRFSGKLIALDGPGACGSKICGKKITKVVTL